MTKCAWTDCDKPAFVWHTDVGVTPPHTTPLCKEHHAHAEEVAHCPERRLKKCAADDLAEHYAVERNLIVAAQDFMEAMEDAS